MPAAIPLAVAGVTAAGGVIQGKIQSNAAKRAAAAQERSGNQALEYQRGRDARSDMFQDKKWAMYEEAVNDWRKRNGGATAASGGGGGGAAVPISLADLVGQQQGIADAQSQDAGSIASMMGGGGGNGVFDWKRYGA